MAKSTPKWIQKRAADMYEDLLTNKQEVVLIPAPEPKHSGHKIRAVQSAPPRWFSDFTAQWLRNSKRQPRLRPNFIKREWTLRGLKRLMQGQDNSIYTQRLRRFIEHEFKNEVPL